MHSFPSLQFEHYILILPREGRKGADYADQFEKSTFPGHLNF